MNIKDKNLPASLEYHKIYDSDIVNKCGNRVFDHEYFKLESIDINLLEEMIKYNHRNWGEAFKDLSSKEFKGGVGRGRHADWVCVARYMEAYENHLFVAPIVIDGTRICDGNHRLYAQYKLGFKEIDVFVKVLA